MKKGKIQCSIVTIGTLWTVSQYLETIVGSFCFVVWELFRSMLIFFPCLVIEPSEKPRNFTSGLPGTTQ